MSPAEAGREFEHSSPALEQPEIFCAKAPTQESAQIGVDFCLSKEEHRTRS